jgi:phenylacetate-coenzyme A ligase PaaK-like adenylate-forming protein
LLTNLANHVQPLIRYDLGDRVTLRESPCALRARICRSSKSPADATPRSGWARRRTACRSCPLALSTVLEEEAGLFDFQLIQDGPRELSLNTARAARPRRPRCNAAAPR